MIRSAKRALWWMSGVLAMAAAVLPASVAAGASGTFTPAGSPAAFELIGRYTTGLADPENEVVSGEVVAVDGKRMYVTNASDVSLDIVDITAPATPVLIQRVDLSQYGSVATSVAASFGLIAVAIANGEAPGQAVFLNARGDVLGRATVGAGPDMLTFAGPLRVLVANEGEPEGYEPGQLDPEGSVSVIDLARLPRFRVVRVRTAGFASFNSQADALKAAGVRVFGPNATVAQDLEPEYIAVDPLLTQAYVTLQENNAIGVLSLIGTPRFTRIVPLGAKDHSLPGNGIDASDRDDRVNIETWPVKGLYMPDAIAAYKVGLRTYLVTANEGDAREYDGFEEEARARSVADLAALPEADDNAKLGRLTVTTAFPASGDSGQQELYAFGARSFSIWDAATGEQVYDSGERLERLTAHVLPDHFNGNNSEDSFDDRSDNKGPEPEGVAVGRVGARQYAFVGLERVGGVVVVDISDPHHPEITQYLQSRTFDGALGPDSGPEVLQFVPALLSPTGRALLAVANEVTGTVTLWGATAADAAGTLTLLHNNDGESSLLSLTNPVSGQTLPVGGAAAFKAVTDREVEAARAARHAVVDVYAGDAFLASATLACSLEDPSIDVHDAVAQRLIPYDAHVLGNHEFDYTPDFLERFVRSFETGGMLSQPFLSANLDVSGEPALDALSEASGLILGETTNGKVIARSAIVRDLTTTLRFGIVAATTWELPVVSSPRDVVVTSVDAASTAAVVQDEISRLQALGVNKILFVSHLQDVSNDRAVVALLRGVDIAVAGGGDELLVNDPADRLPGEAAPTMGTYPIHQADADGRSVPIVTTAGNYKYLGRLVATFDAAGEITAIDATSKPLRVIPTSSVATALGIPDAIAPDAGMTAAVITPVSGCLAAFAATPVAASDVLIDVSRAGVRSRQANGGNLVADAWLAAYDRYAASTGLPPAGAGNPVIAVQNGGGIRQNAGDTLPTGGAGGVISRLDVINVLPFDNTLVVVEGMSPADVKAMLEFSAAPLPAQNGRFLQIAGLSVTYDATQPSGSRVMTAALADGTPLVTAGAIDLLAPASLAVVTNNFTANGGDGYTAFAGKTITTLRSGGGLAIPYELGLREYLESFSAVSGVPTISAGDARYAPYPTGEARITILP
ncbi:MAG TPA: choice-of-anchor I family protein [Myxococcota bacterium]|nr:choice-of-anchor I family protein [Myxococcota bacterium]